MYLLEKKKPSNKKNNDKTFKKETSGISQLISLPGLSAVYAMCMF